MCQIQYVQKRIRCDSHSWEAYGLMEEQADKQMLSRHGGKYNTTAIERMLWELTEQGLDYAWGPETAF